MKRKIQKLYETTSPSSTKFSTACLSKPDCELYAASDENKGIYIWRRGREIPLLNLSGISSIVTSLNLNTTEAELISGLKGGLISIWDLETSKVKFNLAGHSSSVSTLSSFKSEDSSDFHLISASSDGKIKIWDLRSKIATATIKAHSGPIKSISPSPNGRYLATGSEDGFARLWDLKANKLVKEFSLQGQGGVNCVEINPYAITLAYGTNDRTIKHWDLERYSLISVTPFDRTPISKIKFDLTGKNIFSATNESLKYWMIDDDEPKLLYLAEAGWKTLQDLHAIDGQGIFGVSTYGNKISYWNLPWDALSQNNEGDYVKKPNSDIISDFKLGNKNISNSRKIGPNEMSKTSQIYMNNISSNLNNIINKPTTSLVSSENIMDITNFEPNNLTINDMSIIGNINKNQSTFVLNDFNNNYNSELSVVASLNLNDFNNITSTIPQNYPQSNIQTSQTPKDSNILKKNGISIIKSTSNKFTENSSQDYRINQPKTPFTNSGDPTNNLTNNLQSNIINLNNINPINTINNVNNTNTSVFNKNEIIVHKNVVINNINTNLDISNIISSNAVTDKNSVYDNFNYETGLLENLEGLLNMDENDYSETVNVTQNLTLQNLNNTTDTSTFDFNKFINNNNNQDETVHHISQTNDLPLIQEINEKHSSIRKLITQRFNCLNTVSKYWGESNLSATINALTLIKDISVLNDFFNYGFVQREDIEKIPFGFDHALNLLPLIISLINSKFEMYNLTGFKVGMIILRIFNSKITGVYQTAISENDPMLKEERIKKCNELIVYFDKIYKNTNLKKWLDAKKNIEIRKYADSFFTDLEFFLKPYKNKNII